MRTGTYYEVVCYFNPDVPASIDYAYRCEQEAPTTWGKEGAVREYCPECEGKLEHGNGVQLFSFMATEGYLCATCRVIYAHDRTVLARLT